jgi:hypothetical protein
MPTACQKVDGGRGARPTSGLRNQEIPTPPVSHKAAWGGRYVRLDRGTPFGVQIHDGAIPEEVS